MATDQKTVLLEHIWRDQMHTDPQAYDLAPPAVRNVLQSLWEPAQRMRRHLAALPEGLLTLWLASGRGHLVFANLPSAYVPGRQEWRGQNLDGVCSVSVRDLVEEPYAALTAVGDMVDHLLGSYAETAGPWFADGTGATPALQEAALRFGQIQALGYAEPLLGAGTPRAYFSRSWGLYLTEPRRLEVADPLIYRLLHTLMTEGIWRSSA
jgi:hypothetical protein